MTRLKFRYLPPLLLLAVYFYFVQSYCFRDLWFDEALTLLNFAWSDYSLSQIYHNYVIPNNQIVYTVMLHYWLMLQPEGIEPTVWYRLLSVLTGAGTLGSLYFLFKRRFGNGFILLPPLAALAVSVPFLVYASALRGYMLSALFITLALHWALNFAADRRKSSWCGYALFSLLAVGTIPSNLAVLAGVVLYATPLFGNRFLKQKSFWVLALTPIALFLLFYLPILPQFLGVLRLGEGWGSGIRVLLALLCAFCYTFAMLLVPAIGATLAFDRPRYQWRWTIRLAVFLLPIPIALLLPTAPFPRVFFPFWPLWTLLIAGGIRDLTALNCRWHHRWNVKAWLGALTLVVIAWGALAQWTPLRLEFSRRSGGAGADDFFYSYYLRPGHTPQTTIRQLQESHEAEAIPQLYMTFRADPWPLMFYAMVHGLEAGEYTFDGPRGPVTALTPGGIVILHREEKPETLELRFQRKLKPLFQNENHGVYRVQ